jgi:hypothetical protein
MERLILKGKLKDLLAMGNSSVYGYDFGYGYLNGSGYGYGYGGVLVSGNVYGYGYGYCYGYSGSGSGDGNTSGSYSGYVLKHNKDDMKEQFKKAGAEIEET